jgi:hypothetical protein
MTRKRIVLSALAVFLLAQVFGILIHGFILRQEYLPFYGTLLRSQEAGPPWQAMFLPIVHLLMSAAIVRLAILDREGSVTQRGVRVGVMAWMLGTAPTFLLWYAEQPWPGSLVAKQLPLELVAMLAIGLLAARLLRQVQGAHAFGTRGSGEVMARA